MTSLLTRFKYFIFLPLILTFLIFIVGSIISYFHLHETLATQLATKMQLKISSAITATSYKLKLIASMIARDQKIQELVAQAYYSNSLAAKKKVHDKLIEIANYYLRTINFNDKFNNLKIHFHTADLKSLLRNWNPQKWGDNLAYFRHSLVKLKKIKKPFAAFEIGKVGLSLRGFAPIFYEGKYVGSVETIQSVEDLMKLNEEYAIAILVDSKFSKIMEFALDKAINSNNFLVFTKSKLMKEIFSSNDAVKILNSIMNSNFINIKKHIITKLPIKESSGSLIGYIIIANGKDELLSYEKSILAPFITSFVIIFILSSFLIAGVISSYNLLKRIATKAEHSASFFENLRGNLSKVESETKGNLQYLDKIKTDLITLFQPIQETTQQIKHMLSEMAALTEGVENTKNIVKSYVANFQDMEDKQKLLLETFENLEIKIREIMNITALVFKIAEKTNLLALNASIEAARVGKDGAGFAVVASEVKNLADETRRNVDWIKSTLANLMEKVEIFKENADQTNQTLQILKNNTKTVQENVENVSAMMLNISSLLEEVQQISAQIENVSTTSYTNMESILERIENTSKNSAEFLKNMPKAIEEIVEIKKYITG